MGRSAWGGATVYLKRYSFGPCAGTNPPPCFPITGYFTRGRLFEVNPIELEVDELFD